MRRYGSGTRVRPLQWTYRRRAYLALLFFSDTRSNPSVHLWAARCERSGPTQERGAKPSLSWVDAHAWSQPLTLGNASGMPP
jgi:hypothetical protein